MQKPLPPARDRVLLNFMEKTIDNINTCLAGQYTLYKILIEKGLISEADLLSKLKDDKNLPLRKKGILALNDMLKPDWDKFIDFETTELALVKNKICDLTLPPGWGEEGVESPNKEARKNAYDTCTTLYNGHLLVPTTIACTKENGVYLRFENNGVFMVVEAYNDNSVGAIVCWGKVVVHNEDIISLDFERCTSKLLAKYT